MSKINQPHDKYFRSTFGEVGFAKDFLENYLPKELVGIIDMDTLESQSTSYISKELKEQFADLLFRVNIMDKEGYVYFLFEHKSYQDRIVIFQVLKYMIETWEAKLKEDLDKKKKAGIVDSGDVEIPLVIPLVVYHDKYEWKVKRTLGEMIPDYMDLPNSIKKYVPDFEYILSDLTHSDEDKNLREEHSIVIRTLNKARYATKNEIIDIFTEVVNIFTKNKDRDMVNHYIVETVMYLLSSRDDFTERELFEIAGEISEEGGELVMTVADRLREEGIEKGKELGRQEGQAVGIRKSISSSLFNRFDMSDIEVNRALNDITDISTLENLFNKTFQVESYNEFKTIIEKIISFN